MKETQITNLVEFQINQIEQQDFRKLYEDSGSKYYDEGELL